MSITFLYKYIVIALIILYVYVCGEGRVQDCKTLLRFLLQFFSPCTRNIRKIKNKYLILIRISYTNMYFQRCSLDYLLFLMLRYGKNVYVLEQYLLCNVLYYLIYTSICKETAEKRKFIGCTSG